MAISTRNLERGNHSISFLEVLNSGSKVIHDTTELMAEDIAFFQLDDRAVKKVEVGAADSRAGDLENHISIFDDLGFRTIDW